MIPQGERKRFGYDGSDEEEVGSRCFLQHGVMLGCMLLHCIIDYDILKYISI